MNQLSLFDAEDFYEFPKDLLEYRESFLRREEADLLKNKLLKTIPWEQCTQKMYDKMVLTPRLTAWYDDSKYNESEENKKTTNPWTHELLSLKLNRNLGYLIKDCKLFRLNNNKSDQGKLRFYSVTNASYGFGDLFSIKMVFKIYNKHQYNFFRGLISGQYTFCFDHSSIFFS